MRPIKKINVMKKVLIFTVAVCSTLFLFNSCNNDKSDNVDGNTNIEDTLVKTEEAEGPHELPELSIYNLPAEWTNQNGEHIQLEDLRGDIVVAVMIYTSCQASCPRLVADVKRIHDQLDDKINRQIKYVFVSIDPEVDTPEKLKEFAKENKMDNDQWVFLRGTEDDTRTFSATLSVSYKKISPMDFAHSNIISVFDQEGVLTFQKEGLGVDPSEVIQAVKKLAK